MTDIIVEKDQEVAVRDAKGRFLPGLSGNPDGRPVGIKSRATLLREQLDDAVMDVIAQEYYPVLQAMIDQAKGGDVQAGKLVLKELGAIKPDLNGENKSGDITVVIDNYTVNEAGEEDE